MSAASAPSLVSVQDYLDGELHATEKHEYLGGMIHAMAGGSVLHNILSSNALVAVGGRLRGGPCRAINSDQRVRVGTGTGTRFYYPDMSVFCDEEPLGQGFRERPVVLIEVLSLSTRRIDGGEKRDAYLTIPSLRVYAMVEPNHPQVLVDRREGDTDKFTRELCEGLDAVIPLPEIDAELPLRELYEA